MERFLDQEQFQGSEQEVVEFWVLPSSFDSLSVFYIRHFFGGCEGTKILDYAIFLLYNKHKKGGVKIC